LELAIETHVNIKFLTAHRNPDYCAYQKGIDCETQQVKMGRFEKWVALQSQAVI